MARRTFLFIHQNMPAQFIHMVRHLRARGDNVVFVTQNKVNSLAGVTKGVYELGREVRPDAHVYLRPTESAVLHAQAVYRITRKILDQGIRPDLVIGHAGWGETLLIKDLLPKVPLVNYFEFYYRSEGQDLDFDPEYPSDLDGRLMARFKNLTHLSAFESGDWGLTPTQWQMSTFPDYFKPKMSVIHEGIDTWAIAPNKAATFTTPSGKVLHAGQKVITFVARNLEPYRGFHIFMRAIPEIQRRHPDAEIIIVGKDGNGYGRKLPEGDSYKKRMLEEVSFNPDTVHFTGHLGTEHFRAVMHISSAHIYLTYPFVLSWSMLEAMASECLIIGSRTPPVEEVITDRRNGILVDFTDVQGLADAICEALARPQQFEAMRKAARETVLARYDLATVTLPRQIALVDDLLRDW